VNNEQLQHIIKMLEHHESEALNLELSIRQLRSYVETFIKGELENE
jgi:uncharacterized protein (DUF1786 family)